MPHRKLARIVPLAILTAGAVALPAAAQAKGSATAVCKGTEQSCTATFSLAGGASDKQITVELPGTNLKLVHTHALPAYLNGGYLIDDASYSLGGSAWSATLNAVSFAPKGSKVTLKFAQPQRELNCAATKVANFVTVEQTGRGPAGAYSCARAGAVTKAFMRKVADGVPVRTVKAGGTAYRCKLVTTPGPQPFACTGAGTTIRFAGPA